MQITNGVGPAIRGLLLVLPHTLRSGSTELEKSTVPPAPGRYLCRGESRSRGGPRHPPLQPWAAGVESDGGGDGGGPGEGGAVLRGCCSSPFTEHLLAALRVPSVPTRSAWMLRSFYR